MVNIKLFLNTFFPTFSFNSQKIQNEMQYPGQVKVTVIREKRATAFAR